MMDKHQLRKHFKALRNALTRPEIEQMSAQVMENLLSLPVLHRPGAILCYASFGSEVDTHVMIRRLLGQRRTVALPVTQRQSQTMYAAQIGSFESLRRGNFGILEPDSSAAVIEPGKLSAVLVPGLAFDRAGYRIGYGMGFYDRYLPCCPNAVRIALAYDFQLIEHLPHEMHDLPVHYIVTPKEAICCE